MASTAIRGEERIGLGVAVAVAIHVGLVALLLWRPPLGDVTIPPDRIEVTLSDDVAPKSTSPEPQSDARADVAPELGEPAEAEPEPEAPPPAPRVEPPKPEPRPVVKPKPQPRPVASPKPVAKPVAKPVTRPTPPRPAAKPVAKPVTKPAQKPATRPATKPATKPAAKPAAAAVKPPANVGGSRVGSDFLEGVRGGQATTPSRNPPAQVASAAVKASLKRAISEELRPHWQAKVPDGADSEKLVTILRWSLNRDGTIAGAIVFKNQTGRTEANQPQWDRHKEQAIRAVQLAAPFHLPEEYYNSWKTVEISFDKGLAR